MGSHAGTSRSVAFVTGGTAGIGRATVRELAHRGWGIGVIARSQERLDATAREVKAAGRRALMFSADVADHHSVERAADAIEQSGERPNTWEPVYGAEVVARGKFDDRAHAHSPELWLGQHRGLVGAGAVLAAGALTAVARR